MFRGEKQGRNNSLSHQKNSIFFIKEKDINQNPVLAG